MPKKENNHSRDVNWSVMTNHAVSFTATSLIVRMVEKLYESEGIHSLDGQFQVL